jgi:cytochrome b subunit of formate dehydrogenase
MSVPHTTRTRTGQPGRRAWPLMLLRDLGLGAPLVVALAGIFAWLGMAAAKTDSQRCFMCHGDKELVSQDGRKIGIDAAAFRAGVHGDFDCVDCHTSPGNYEELPHYKNYVPVDCGTCHETEMETYKVSSHGKALKRGDKRAPDCAACHGLHGILAPSDSTSPTNPANVARMCGACHGAQQAITKDYVRLPISLPSYLSSVHEAAMKEGKRAAVCSDCHGAHDIRPPADPESSINHARIAGTCGECHEKEAADYRKSIHGKAVALDLPGAPTCTDCHDEHSIKKAASPIARTSPERQARELCGDCHTNPELVGMYGIRAGVVESYLDSYHGWTVGRRGGVVATCTDCHNVHDINGPMDPTSSVSPENVTATCGRCHEGSNPTFAKSYTHESALQARGYHGWARLIYLWIIAVVLGSMALHTLFIIIHELIKHFRGHRRQSYVVRWGFNELLQHWILLASFTGLAITGFALRFPDAWWVKLIGLGAQEAIRSNLHRVLAVILIGNGVYHFSWAAATRRGRSALREVFPRFTDFKQMIGNMAFMLGRRPRRPAFARYDYSQKIEYWAVVWGTFVMAATGFILWFPTAATNLMPAWVVRVAEVIHFYEAILAVSAVVIWHFFHVIFMPSEYPMSTVWIDGRIPATEWKDLHRGDYEQMGERPIRRLQNDRGGPTTGEQAGRPDAKGRSRRWYPRQPRDRRARDGRQGEGGGGRESSSAQGPKGAEGDSRRQSRSRRRRPRRWRKKNP